MVACSDDEGSLSSLASAVITRSAESVSDNSTAEASDVVPVPVPVTPTLPPPQATSIAAARLRAVRVRTRWVGVDIIASSLLVVNATPP